MADLRFQLVFQFAAADLQVFDDLMSLEQELCIRAKNRLDLVVDGHDFGMGEFNVFIHTNDPRNHFEEVAEWIGSLHANLAFAAGYRAFADDEYVSLWPGSASSFAVA